jgi:hypothetical protein
MPDTTTEPATRQPRDAGSGWRRLGWFVLLWGGSLGVWLLIAYGLRRLLVP